MPSRPSFFSSSVGSKILIGLTGLLLFGFLLSHLAGNLTLLGGPVAFNAYTEKMASFGPLLWVAEAGLIAIFLVHVVKTMLNYRRNAAARPAAYQDKKWAGHTSRKSWASTSMAVTGLVILVFVISHVKMFKFGAWYVDAATGERDLFRLVAEIFSNPIYVVAYVITMGLVGLHLSHGLSSAVQSLGLSNQRVGRGLVLGGRVLAAIIAGGFAMLPIYMYLAHQVAQ